MAIALVGLKVKARATRKLVLGSQFKTWSVGRRSSIERTVFYTYKFRPDRHNRGLLSVYVSGMNAASSFHVRIRNETFNL